MPNQSLPSLDGWETTKETLHAYSKVVGAIPRAHAEFHPKWWHISLKVQPDGLVTTNMRLPQGGIFFLRMNFHTHVIELVTSDGIRFSWSMAEGLTANQLAEKMLGAVASLGLDGEYVREKFESDKPRVYNSDHAENYFSALVYVDALFKKHRAQLDGERGPVQLWPHGFDLAFEWFGTRMIEYEEHGKKSSFPSQLNLGFSPGEPNHPKPYFYSNPFPFEDDKLIGTSLPHGASWFTESWKGSLMEYKSLVGDSQAGQKLLDYARAVYDIASPGFMA
jgi:hypothetical protein